MLPASVSISGYFATLALLVVISLALRDFDQPVDQPGSQLLSDHGQHGHHTHARVLPLLSRHPTLPAAPGGGLYCCECLSVVARCTSLDSFGEGEGIPEGHRIPARETQKRPFVLTRSILLILSMLPKHQGHRPDPRSASNDVARLNRVCFRGISSPPSSAPTPHRYCLSSTDNIPLSVRSVTVPMFEQPSEWPAYGPHKTVLGFDNSISYPAEDHFQHDFYVTDTDQQVLPNSPKLFYWSPQNPTLGARGAIAQLGCAPHMVSRLFWM